MTDTHNTQPNGKENQRPKRNDPDWAALWAETDKDDQEKRRKKEHYASLSVQELADDLRARCNISDGDTLETLAQNLFQTSLLLNCAFTKSIHDAGLGGEGRIQLDGMRCAMLAQRLMHQTYKTLSKEVAPAHREFFAERTKEPKKDE